MMPRLQPKQPRLLHQAPPPLHELDLNQQRQKQRCHTSRLQSSAHCWRGAQHARRPLRVSVRCAMGSPNASFDDGSPLGAQRRLLKQTRVLRKEPRPHDDDIIQLNVGGCLMVTNRSTLLQFPHSRLAAMFAKGNDAGLQRDFAGNVFLDFEPRAFGPVLSYLRDVAMAAGDPTNVPLPLIRQEDERAFHQLAAYLRVGPTWVQYAGSDGTSAVVECPQGHADSHDGCPISSGRSKSSELLLRRPHAHPGLPSGSTSSSGSGGSKSSSPVRPQITNNSQLSWVQAHEDRSCGTKLSVHTEEDLRCTHMEAAHGPRDVYDLFCDATWGEPRLSLTLVQRTHSDNLFVGVTSRNQVDQRGLQIPCFGWKRIGWRYGGASVAAGGGGSSSSSGSDVAGDASGSAAGVQKAQQLWKKGDSVELVVELGAAATAGVQGSGRVNRLLLKVNGVVVDHMCGVPSFRHWCWYVALFSKGDVSCVVFEPDCYSVYWGDYHVKRYLR